jgi:hypothetical protein
MVELVHLAETRRGSALSDEGRLQSEISRLSKVESEIASLC